MADGISAGVGVPADVVWTFPGQLGTDQDSFIYSLKASRPLFFVAFDANARIAPVGTPILVDFSINGVINPNCRVTINVGSTFGTTTFALGLSIGDEIRPIVSQVGSSTPGQTLLIRARSS